jgi:hypothetical protein
MNAMGIAMGAANRSATIFPTAWMKLAGTARETKVAIQFMEKLRCKRPRRTSAGTRTKE